MKWFLCRLMALKGKKNGVTLLEILIAVAIMSVLFLALYETFFSVLNGQARIETELEQTRQIRRFLDIISLEIQSSFFKDNNPKTIFVGERKHNYGRSLSQITLTTFTYPVMKEGYPASDLTSVQYFAEETEKGRLTLYKKMWNPYTGNEMNGFKADVIDDIEGFEVSYFSGSDWAKAWDSSLEKRLPGAVKISLAVKDMGAVKEFTAIARTRIR